MKLYVAEVKPHIYYGVYATSAEEARRLIKGMIK